MISIEVMQQVGKKEKKDQFFYITPENNGHYLWMYSRSRDHFGQHQKRNINTISNMFY
jgi:hypothetical protein